MSLDSLQVTEDASAAVATALRITKEFIESQIVNKVFVTGDVLVTAGGGWGENPEKSAHLTICTIRVHNGFIVIGKSAPMDPENFNAPLGRQLAYEDAFRQLWPLYAFAKLEDELLYGKDEGPNPNNDGESPSPNSAAPTAE